MILAVDVGYRDARARVAGFLFREWVMHRQRPTGQLNEWQ